MGSQQVEDSHAINHSLGPMKMQKFRECFKNNTPPPPFMFHRATHSHQLLAEVLSYINLSYCLSSLWYFRLLSTRSLKNSERFCLQYIC